MEADRQRQARDRERAERLRQEATARAIRAQPVRDAVRCQVRYPNARVSVPDLRRDRSADWGEPAATAYREEYSSTQGYSGVYDPRTGRLVIRPSTPARAYGAPFSRPPPGWVIRGGGHLDIAREMSGGTYFPPRSSRARLRAFTVVRDGQHFVIRWDSYSVNAAFHRQPPSGMGGARHLPEEYRAEVLAAVRFHTGEYVRDASPAP
jgi:hypothetical protein